MAQVVLALDQGTTSSRSIVFRHSSRPAAAAQREFPQIFPSPGHVEHGPGGDLDDAVGHGPCSAPLGRHAGARRGGDRHHQPTRDDRRLGEVNRGSGYQCHRLAESDLVVDLRSTEGGRS